MNIFLSINGYFVYILLLYPSDYRSYLNIQCTKTTEECLRGKKNMSTQMMLTVGVV